ncbi:hypothetical protein [Amycolatopsis sp. EV170708-02-1]|uniref:hypothetical protein n=1 Tax=Amycolatopsis sp. EV170708-02-1 TaxID=2919322 RepID=UPI001F0BD662|nr:hypothetical protein [Amycolatopsis sp. EV170708-02-1]UMP02139.1 hypothetical protein MJQ72_38005 [Amycolatopsis sp. EV170708-02-1]
MAGLKIDGSVVGDYAKRVDAAAGELDLAAAEVTGEGVTVESHGTLGEELGLGASYRRAAEAIQRQLVEGAAALRSASEALHTVTARHAGHDDEAAQMIKRAVEL